MKYILNIFLVLILGLLPFTVCADTLLLRDGTLITGRIQKSGANDIVVNTIIGELTIDRDKILKVLNIDDETLEIESDSRQLTFHEREQLAGSISNATTLKFLLNNPESSGLGFILGRGLGIYFAYDYDFSLKSQLHVQFDWKTSSILSHERNIEGYPKPTFVFIDISTQKIMTTYRFFPFSTAGFYLGTGAGISSSTFILDNISSNDYTNSAKPIHNRYVYAYKSHRRDVFVIGELGLQSRSMSEYNRHYLNIGLQLAKIINSNDSFDINQLQNSPFNNEIMNLHEEQIFISQLSVGFGVYF